MEKKITVLMVDDEEQFRVTTNKILTRRGFDTIMAESGEEAIAKLSQNPDVIILDIKMKGMDGHETLAEIKKRKPKVPVIMLTGHGDLSSARSAHREGAYDYLSKPCDIDVLVGKIRDAHRRSVSPQEYHEKAVIDVMIPIDEYTTLTSEMTVKDAILALKKSFQSQMATSQIMETGHRSLLVVDKYGKVTGALTILDLMQMIMPAYLSAPKPSLADSIQYSPMFWDGMFTTEIKRMAARKIEEVMSPAPYTIDGTANLMEAAFMMLTNNVRRLSVMRGGEVVGVVREQDLFFEMDKILSE
ncbi:MAG: response regulator [Desulfobacteraceae bacterium]|nr:MAG: response regulator [Desulfobacteraceae bacterium]